MVNVYIAREVSEMSNEEEISSKEEKEIIYEWREEEFIADIQKVKERLEERLLLGQAFEIEAMEAEQPVGAENIIGVGIGEKYRSGRPTGELCVKVYVIDKLPESEMSEEFVVQSEVEGFKTDVEEVGELVAFGPITKRCHRPIQPGISIGHVDITAGTFGSCARDRRNPLLLLSNNHVFANENRARIGDFILQPGKYDGGVHDAASHPGDCVCTKRDKCVATLYKFIPINFSGGANLVDAAVAKPLNPKCVRCDILGIGRVMGTVVPARGMRVKKSGRTTQLTHGSITDTNATVRVRYNSGIALFKDQVIIRPGGFSAGGDSGSLILERTSNKACALLFAGSSVATIANKIQNVQSTLGITVI
ncbi:hypothetical protein ig2599ANME_2379 [groundwater metagenome]